MVMSQRSAQHRRGQAVGFPPATAARVSPVVFPLRAAADAPSVGTPSATGKCPQQAEMAPVRTSSDLRTQIKVDLYATLRESSRSREQVLRCAAAARLLLGGEQ